MAEGIERRKTAAGISYKARVYDARAGKRVSRTFPTLAEARRWRAAKLDEAARGIGIAGPTDRLRDVAEKFLLGARAGTVRTRSGTRFRPIVVREYERSLRLHVLPMLGAAPIGRVQRRDLQSLADAMLAAGADPSTIRNALKPVQAIYRRAIEDGELAVNPCLALRLPAAIGRRERIAAPEEARALIAATRPQHRALWGCAFYAGLRRGELRALHWDAIDFPAGLIRVEKSMNAYGELSEPKTRAGRRSVPIVAALAALLADHRVLTNHVDGFVFGSTPLTPFTPTNVRRSAIASWNRAKLEPIGLHECRHTFASILIAAGVNARAITAYMGHASIQITFDLYGHLMPGNEREAVALIDAFLGRESAG
jgi:integrase